MIRFGAPGHERPGLEMEDGTRLDLSAHIEDYDSEFFASGGLERLGELSGRLHVLPVVAAGERLGPPVARPHKFLAIGLNYHGHANELGLPAPSEPVLFTKATSCICGPGDGIIIPRGGGKLDYEVELAIVMKKQVRYLESEQPALECVAGFTICNDVSERTFQIEQGGQWVKGKSCDSFGPLGPWLVTPEELPDYGSLELALKVNGEERQRGNTNDLIFSIPFLVSYLSRFMTLEPGDVITTGTPAGVAMGMKPPRYLQEGDRVELTISGLGSQHQLVRAEG